MADRILPALLLALLAVPALAHEGPKPGPDAKAAVSPAEQKGTRDPQAYFTDTELLTQDGKTVRFYSDVLKDRVVLINVVYTSCDDACPLITHKLAEVKARLGERFGKEVFFVSLSSDPERDSPSALKKFARKNEADAQGWTFLTGTKENVDRVLARLGQLSQTVEDHSTLLIAGNVPAKRWSKIRPDAPVKAISERLELLAKPVKTGGLAQP